MSKILDGTGKGNEAKVDSNNRLHVKAITESDLEAAAEDGNTFSWSNATYNYTGADTILAVKNTDTSKNLHITKVLCSGDTATNVQIHLITAAYTSAGTEVTGTNLNGNSNNVANAEGYADETGNTQGSLIANQYIVAGGESSITDLEGAVILGQNHAIGVDFVTVGAAAYVTILGHYEDPA